MKNGKGENMADTEYFQGARDWFAKRKTANWNKYMVTKDRIYLGAYMSDNDALNMLIFYLSEKKKETV